MDISEIKMLTGTEDLSITEVMAKIDQNAYGILFLVDDNSKLLGCVTDGDIRRFLLSGGTMSDNVKLVMNHSPKYAKSRAEAKSLYHTKNFIVIPVVDEEGKVVDYYAGDYDESILQTHNAVSIPVVINAGGKGTRLDPFTKILPKPLIPVGELPIIEHIMKEYQSYECNDFHVIVNYKKDLIKAYFADDENHYCIHWYDEEKPLGTGGGLSLLKGKIKGTFFFSNCDNLLTADYSAILEYHREMKNEITMICVKKGIDIPYGVVELEENELFKQIVEKPKLSFLVNTGIYVVESTVLDSINNDEAIGFPDIIIKERQNGRKVSVYTVNENDWMDMGQLPELEKMRRRLYGD